jgi:membrane protease YdiL (CAAX protease family)
MPRTWRGCFLLAVGIGWILLVAAGVCYARLKQIPLAVAVPLLAAFLLEYVFYLVPGFQQMREWLANRIPPRPLAFSFALSALAPYLLYSLATSQFQVVAASRLAALVLVLCFWYIIRRPSPTADLALLALIAAALITRFFRQIYTSPIPGVPLGILGQLMLIRLYASVMLILREVEGTGFGFLPDRKDWRVGLRYFLYFLPVGLALSFGLGLVHFRTSPMELARAPLQFLGALWVLALSEEFLARGLLQRWLSDWTGRRNLALLLASATFGFCHLWFRGFPNWRFAILATTLGWFCGKAFNQADGIRAPMVTHALIVTVWQTFLS